MLRRNRQIRMQIHQLVDTCLFAFSFWLAFYLRAHPDVVYWFGLDPYAAAFKNFAWLYVVLIPAAPLVLEAQGFYQRPVLCSRWITIWQLAKGCSIVTVGLIVALFLDKTPIARWVMVWFGVIRFVLVFLKEELMRAILRSELAQTQRKRRFILVGTEEETARMGAELEVGKEEGIEILAELNLNDSSIEQLVQLLHEHSVNGVILSAKHSYFEQVEAAIRACELEGVEAWLVADFFRTNISRTSFDDFQGRPVLVFRTTPEASWQGVFKQLIDFVGALVLLTVSFPVLIAAVVFIKLTSPGPILFRQQRSGLNGRPFTIYKFRTMVTDAEQRKHELAAMNEMSGPVFKVTNDPRITPIGRLLRKFSIDEFPQLFNVLRGEMSLVGPRPLPVDEVKRFNDLSHRRRLSVKPGLTCLWQISGRNNVKDFKDWVRLDLEYIDNWSIWLDLKILWWTVPVVLTGTGAK
jgi:exopolysaccharide biosynthesis polyprenyl glycosylphosphotransferase